MADDRITRRDFLDGVAITAAGLAAAAAAPHLTGAEAALRRSAPARRRPTRPPTPGMRACATSVIRDTMEIDGLPNPRDVHTTNGGPGIHPRSVRDVDDVYDLVVVGAGASGLAAAKWYQDRFGAGRQDPDPRPAARLRRALAPQRVPHPRRHQRRRDVMILRNGGTVNLDSIGTWNKPMAACSTSRASTASRRSTCSPSAASTRTRSRARAARASRARSACARCCSSRARTGARTRSCAPRPAPSAGRTSSRPRRTRPRRARASSASIEDETTDWITLKDGPKTDQEKKAILARITYKRYLMDYVGANEQATGYFQRVSHGLFAAGIQATQAGDMWALEEDGFAGLGLTSDIFPGIGRTAQQDIDGRRPDARVAGRQHVAAAPAREQADPERLSRTSTGARPTQENILVAQCRLPAARPARTTTSASASTTRSSHVKPGSSASATTPRSPTSTGDGRKGERVRAKHVVMACWNRVTARLVDGPPERTRSRTSTTRARRR